MMQTPRRGRLVGGVWSARILRAAVLGALFAAGCAAPRVQESYYLDEAQTIPIRIRLDEIGIVLRPGPPDTLPSAYTDSLGLTVIDSLPGRLFIAKLDAAVSRPGVVTRAREALSLDTNLVAHTGMVVTRVNATRPRAPMIATDYFVVQFGAGVDTSAIDSLNIQNAVTVVEQTPGVPNQYLLMVTAQSSEDAIGMANRYFETGKAVFAHPNFIHVLEPAGDPNDPLLGEQWHHRNDGSDGGTVDADMDTDLAWEVQRGSPDVTIAVIDGGFDVEHEDLVNALWSNPDEAAGVQGVDDDGNGYVDDIHGWNFYECDLTGNAEGCGDLTLDPARLSSTDLHGTATASLAGATGDNGKGGVGVGFGSRLMLLRYAYSQYEMAKAFDYARDKNADVITNSWRILPDNRPDAVLRRAIKRAAEQGRSNRAGAAVFFAMSDEDTDDCQSCTGCPEGMHMLEDVISVSASDHNDQKNSLTGYGDCTDLLAPANGATTISRRIVTSDQHDHPGYNSDHASALTGAWGPCPRTESGDLGYTYCFTGTSASTPLAAGVAGLVFAANPDLSGANVRQILQDSADRVDVTDEDTGGDAYDGRNGRGVRRGFGRVNAYEAVTLAKRTATATGGEDVFLRDGPLDWGNTSETAGRVQTWEPTDIKLELVTTGGAPPSFDEIVSETPKPGTKYKILTRVRNRSPQEGAYVTLRLYGTEFQTAPADLPSDFWDTLSDDTVTGTSWKLLGKLAIRKVLYSGASAAGGDEDKAWVDYIQDASGKAAEVELLPTGASLPTNYCVFAVLDSAGDPASGVIGSATSPSFDVDELSNSSNNMTQVRFRIE